MKNSLLVLSLLLICLPPCAAQNSPPRRQPSPRQAALHSATPKPIVLRPVTGGPFSDVPKDHWAAAAVETLRRRGIVKGYPASR